MSAARLAARCVELLGAVEGPVDLAAAGVLGAPLAAATRSARDEPPAAAVCDFRGVRGDGGTRATRLAAVAACLPPGAPLVVVDYNQPRAWWRRLVGAVLLALHGLPPSRARHPVARDVVAHGFAIERLRLADGERVQLVLARRR